MLALGPVLATAAGVVVMLSAEPADYSDLVTMAPTEVEGWTPKQPDGFYDGSNLFDYINGGAEVYRSFNVQRVLARQYAKPGEEDILADIFDMGSSQDAFGVYHHDMREGDSAGIGQESEYIRGVLSFWKGRHFVSVLSMDETADSKRAVLALGRAIAQAIREEGPAPDLLRLLPPKGRLPQHLYYFHDQFCLNAHYYVADENLLELGPDTEGVLARYRRAKAKDGPQWVLAVIRYPSVAKAKKALAGFLKRYLPDADAEGMAQTEDGKWAGVRRDGAVIVGVFDAPSQAEIQRMVEEVVQAKLCSEKKKECKDEQD